MRLPSTRLAVAKESWAAAAAAGSPPAAVAAQPGTSSGHRSRPTTCTTAAAIPTGTASRMARAAESRPTPMATGASSAAPAASTRNQLTTADCDSRKESRTSPVGCLRTSG